MKVEKFKNLIKESIKEVLVEEGLLKEVITAVMQEAQQAPQSPKLAAQEDHEISAAHIKEKNNEKISQARAMMMETIGKSSYSDLYNLEGIDLFEGTTPLGRGGTPGEAAAGQGPLSGVEPDDAGVAIDSLLGNKKLWQQLMKK